MKEKCDKPPEGWLCSRESGHDGPCAVRPNNARQHDNFYICSAVVACVALICYTVILVVKP